MQEVKYVSTKFENNQQLKPETQSNKTPDTLFLYVSVILAQMLIVVSGANAVWTSPALIKLTSNDTEINPIGRPVTTMEVSLIGGIPYLSALVGSVVLPKLSDFLGRKRHLLLMGIWTLLASVALAFSKKVIYIIISRSFQAFAIWGAWTIIPIYIAEISETHNRGKFGCFTGLFHQIGHFFGFVVGPLFSVKTFSLIITAPALVFLMFFIIVPESPIYLMSKGKEKECKESLRKFRNNKSEEDLETDFLQIKENLKDRAQAKKANVLDLFKKRHNRLALMMALLPLLVQCLCGITIIMIYLAPFFNAAGTSISGNVVAVIVSTVKVSTYFFTSFVVEKFGRRRMLLISTTGTGIPLFALGVYFYLQYINSTLINSLQWLPLLAVLSNVFLYSLGLGPVPISLYSELFPSELRAVSSSVINTVLTLIVFGLSTGFPLISEAYGMHWCVWLFSLCTFVGAILIYFFLPETKDKSFSEIQEMLRNY